MEQVTEKYKHTEVGLIPSDWSVTKLFEVIETNRSIRYGIVQPGKFEPDGCLMLRSQDYSKGWSNSDEMHRVNVALENQYKNARLNKGDLIMTVVGAGIGQVVIAPDWLDKAIVSRSTARIAVDKTKAAKEYILCCLTSPLGVRQILDAQKEGAQPVISCLDLAKFNIPYPSLEEQTAIATALSDANALISSLEKLISKKRNIKQGAMQKLLKPKEGWEVKKFSEVCWYQEGPGLRNWQFTKRGIKVINVTNLENGILNLDRTERHISLEEFHKMYEHFEIDENDIVVASSGNSYGKVARVRSQDLPLVMNTSVIRFKPLKDLDYKFLWTFLNSPEFKNQIDLLITGGAQPNFGPAHLNKLSIRLPKSKEEQTRIATILSDMDAELSALETKLEKYKKVKLGMMQNLLTGKIRLI